MTGLILGSKDYYPTVKIANIITVICAITGTLALLVVLLRIYTRWRYVVLKWDDGLVAIAMLFFAVYCTSASLATRTVEQNPGLTLSELGEGVDFLNISEIFYVATIIPLKLSVGLFYLRLVMRPAQKRIIYVSMAVNTVFGVIMEFYTIFQCGIYKDGIDFTVKRLNNKCASDPLALGMTYTHGAITMSTDWIFVLMPIWLLKDSLMSIREKFTIGFILAFASVSGIASIIRLLYIHRLSGPKLDFFAGISNLAIWSALEPGVGIICCSLVTLRPLFWRNGSSKRSGYLDRSTDNSHIPSFVAPKHPDALKNTSEDRLVDLEKDGIQSPHHHHHNHHHTHQQHMNHRPTLHSGAHQFVCLKCQEHAQMTALPPPPEPKKVENIYLPSERKNPSKPSKIGKIFNPVRSKEREPGFGLNLFGSTFANSMTNSSSSKSIWGKSSRSGRLRDSGLELPRQDPTDQMYDHYERIAMQSPSRQEMQMREADSIPHDAAQWTRQQYSRTTINSPQRRELPSFPSSGPIQMERSVQIPKHNQSLRPFQSPQSALSPRSSVQSPHSTNSQRPLLSTVNYLKPLPPPPAERKESKTYKKTKTRNTFTPKRSNTKEPGLPLDLFSIHSTTDDDTDTRKSWF